jgi:hypothetical protein
VSLDGRCSSEAEATADPVRVSHPRGSGGQGRMRNVARPPPPDGAAQLPDGHGPQRRSPRNCARPGRRSRRKQPITSPAHPDHPPVGDVSVASRPASPSAPLPATCRQAQRPSLGTNRSGLPQHSRSLAQRTAGRDLASGPVGAANCTGDKRPSPLTRGLSSRPRALAMLGGRPDTLAVVCRNVPVHSAAGDGDVAHSGLRATTTT